MLANKAIVGFIVFVLFIGLPWAVYGDDVGKTQKKGPNHSTAQQNTTTHTSNKKNAKRERSPAMVTSDKPSTMQSGAGKPIDEDKSTDQSPKKQPQKKKSMEESMKEQIVAMCGKFSKTANLKVTNKKDGVNIDITTSNPGEVSQLQQCGQLLQLAYQLQKTQQMLNHRK